MPSKGIAAPGLTRITSPISMSFTLVSMNESSNCLNPVCGTKASSSSKLLFCVSDS